MIWSIWQKECIQITIKRHKTQVLNYFTQLLGHFNNATINEFKRQPILQEILLKTLIALQHFKQKFPAYF